MINWPNSVSFKAKDPRHAVAAMVLMGDPGHWCEQCLVPKLPGGRGYGTHHRQGRKGNGVLQWCLRNIW